MEIELPGYVSDVMARLQEAGYEAYVVGGCVRDSLLGRTPGDWDMTSSALPEQAQAALTGLRVIGTGIQHGTVTAVTGGGPVEITTYRVDGSYSDSRHPDRVQFTRCLREDLARRDFTVNAMAYAPQTGVVDYFGGMEDLQKHRITCVGDPEQRFSEDALRILRGLRIASTLDFEIEERTAAAIRQRAPLLQRVAAERLQSECTKLLNGHPDRLLAGFPQVLRQLFPELETFPPVERVPAGLRLPLLLSPLSPAQAYRVLERLRYDNATQRRTKTMLLWLGESIPANRPALRRLVGALGYQWADDLLRLQHAARGTDTAAQRQLLKAVAEDGDCCTLEQLAVNGKDLLAAGIPTGKALGALLDTLLRQVVEDALPNRRDALLRAALKWKGGGQDGNYPAR